MIAASAGDGGEVGNGDWRGVAWGHFAHCHVRFLEIFGQWNVSLLKGSRMISKSLDQSVTGGK